LDDAHPLTLCRERSKNLAATGVRQEPMDPFLELIDEICWYLLRQFSHFADVFRELEYSF
jgi:hypothetical protein